VITRTIYFGSPAYLSIRNEQLVHRPPDTDKETVIPIEDVGVVILDHGQITITHSVFAQLLANNVAVITCDRTHHPTGLLLNLAGHTLQSMRFRAQIAATKPMLKQLWQQTVRAKLINQASALEEVGVECNNLREWARAVTSGDTSNLEGRAAAYYWRRIFPDVKRFKREPEGEPPNNLLNFGYAIIRACVARSLVGSGLLPTLGIFHRNQYNHYCLADDIMEPYRPFVDVAVRRFCKEMEAITITPEIKRTLLSLPTEDVIIDGCRSPLMVAVQRTTASLARCFEKTSKVVLYPTFPQ